MEEVLAAFAQFDNEQVAKAIQAKLDRSDEAFLFERSIDIETYDRHAETLREELTLARIDRHSGQLKELDVEGILAFAERVLPRASDLWVQASLEQRQRFQQLFFPDGIAFDGNQFIGTGVTAPAFSYLRPIDGGNEGLVDQTGVVPAKASAKREADVPEERQVRQRASAASEVGGPDGSRTRDLMNAIHARSQLRYWPTLSGTPSIT
jgi:hypothetical protein